jgi:hypothetical protein
MNILMQTLVNKIPEDSWQLTPWKTDSWKLILKEGIKINDMSEFVHKTANGKPIKGPIIIGISGTPFPYVQPQATFQFPLSHMSNFLEYMVVVHKRLKKALDATKNFIKKYPEITEDHEDHGFGLSLLTILYCELLASPPEMSKELGPKSYLPLMSRLAFSDMYADLGEIEKVKFSKLMNQYSNEKGKKSLFPLAYALNIGSINVLDSVWSKKCMEKVLTKIKSVTFEDFIDSIQKPNEKTVEENKKLLMQSLQCLVDSEKIAGISNEDIKQVLSVIDTFDYNGKDILSPPPFLSSDYSMGKVGRVKRPDAILEMRGYRQRYGTSIVMGTSISLLLSREIEQANLGWPLMTHFETYNAAKDFSHNQYTSCLGTSKSKEKKLECAKTDFKI